MSPDYDPLLFFLHTCNVVEVQITDYIVRVVPAGVIGNGVVQPDLCKTGSARQVTVGVGAIRGIRVCCRPWHEQAEMERRCKVAMGLVTRVPRDVETRVVRI